MNYSSTGTELYGLPFETSTFNGMPYRKIGESGLRASNIGLGTWKFGYPETGDGSRIGAVEAFSLFDSAIEMGVTFWDTANRYNNASGNSERVIGEWFKNNPAERRKIVLATKLGGAMDGMTPNHCGLSRTNILNSVYASLERLQTDYIDILYFHQFDSLTPVHESLLAIDDLVSRDLIRYFGVSNFSTNQLKAYQKVNSKLSLRSRMIAVQNQFDILEGERQPNVGVRKLSFETGISFIAWGPLARGLLSGRYLDMTKIGPGDRLHDEGEIKEDVSWMSNMEKVEKLEKLSREWGIGLTQLVLAYMLTLPGMGPVIPSSININQLKLNALAAKIELDTGQKSRIRQIAG